MMEFPIFSWFSLAKYWVAYLFEYKNWKNAIEKMKKYKKLPKSLKNPRDLGLGCCLITS